MTETKRPLEVRSHVARDLLQNAALFKTDKLVVWEYVSNSLQYVDPAVNPIVEVKLDSKAKQITVADNGRGMDWDGLGNFFVMHGENLDRKLGHGGRGRFGTGKAAAFGIGEGGGMTRQQTSSLTLKSIAGSVLAGPGLFVLRGTLNEIAAQLNQLRGSTPGEGLGVLHLVMLAASFNHHRIAQGLLQMFVTFWPLLPAIVGAGLLWNAFTNKDQGLRPSGAGPVRVNE